MFRSEWLRGLHGSHNSLYMKIMTLPEQQGMLLLYWKHNKYLIQPVCERVFSPQEGDLSLQICGE